MCVCVCVCMSRYLPSRNSWLVNSKRVQNVQFEEREAILDAGCDSRDSLSIAVVNEVLCQ